MRLQIHTIKARLVRYSVRLKKPQQYAGAFLYVSCKVGGVLHNAVKLRKSPLSLAGGGLGRG